eukprot:1153187-Pelagomonas_calceolata.AAC.1
MYKRPGVAHAAFRATPFSWSGVGKNTQEQGRKLAKTRICELRQKLSLVSAVRTAGQGQSR